VLGSLVTEAGADVAAAAEANKVRVAAPAKQVSVVSDTDLLGTVVDSLVDNAVKYSTEGGTVTSDVNRRGGNVELSVHNDGSSIDADKLNELFQPFVRAEGDALADFSKQGMGFSLYLDKIIMDYLDGSISAKSEAGKGTTVSIRLPG
jgi:signal transduction histidine kinase